MRPDPATGSLRSGNDVHGNPGLSESDANWIRRGERLGELLLTSRKVAGLGWAAALVLAGCSLVVLALLGPPERAETADSSPITAASASSD